jgi:hypothetical protein
MNACPVDALQHMQPFDFVSISSSRQTGTSLE